MHEAARQETEAQGTLIIRGKRICLMKTHCKSASRPKVYEGTAILRRRAQIVTNTPNIPQKYTCAYTHGDCVFLPL